MEAINSASSALILPYQLRPFQITAAGQQHEGSAMLRLPGVNPDSNSLLGTDTNNNGQANMQERPRTFWYPRLPNGVRHLHDLAQSRASSAMLYNVYNGVKQAWEHRSRNLHQYNDRTCNQIRFLQDRNESLQDADSVGGTGESQLQSEG